MLVYKFDVLKALYAKGWTRTTLQRERGEDGKVVLGSEQVQRISYGKVISARGLDKLCKLLDMQLGDIVEYIPDNRYKALKKSGYFDEIGIPTPPLGEEGL